MYNETMINKRTKGINWDTAIFMTLFHLAAVAALFMFSWQASHPSRAYRRAG